MSRRLEISPHAVSRYVERIDPAADDATAEEAIRAAMLGARRLHGQGRDKALYQAGGELRFRMVVRQQPGRPAAVMTVLPLRDEDVAEDSDEGGEAG